MAQVKRKGRTRDLEFLHTGGWGKMKPESDLIRIKTRRKKEKE